MDTSEYIRHATGASASARKVGAPTPPFRVLTEEDYPREIDTDDARDAAMKLMMDGVAAMNTSEPGLIKSIHGGGGKGPATRRRSGSECTLRPEGVEDMCPREC